MASVEDSVMKFVEPTTVLMAKVKAFVDLSAYLVRVLQAGVLQTTITAGNAVTSITVSGLTSAPASTGTLQLINSAGKRETVSYTARVAAGANYTFTVNKTFTYSYATSNVCNVVGVNENFIYWKTQYDQLFNFLDSIRDLPCAVIVYTGSNFQNVPRRLAKFSVFVLYKNLRDGVTGSAEAQKILDDVTDQIDHQIYNQALFLVAGDEPIDFEGTGLVAYKIDFVIQDH
jgi:hypothetical protein